MPHVTVDELSDLPGMWNSPDAAEPEGFQHLPEGDYVVRIDTCRFERSQKMQRLIKWEFTVVAGPTSGRKHSRINMIETPQNVGWLKKDLRSAGVNIDDPAFNVAEFIANGTTVLIGKLLNITVKKGKPGDDGRENYNTFINGIATDADVVRVNAGGAVNSGSAAPKSAPTTPAATPPPATSNPWDG